jgi:hypothetical protein
MIGPSNRVPGAHAPQIETALALTVPGQAIWADPTIPHSCGDCAHWDELRARGKNLGLCRSQARPPGQADRKTAACAHRADAFSASSNAPHEPRGNWPSCGYQKRLDTRTDISREPGGRGAYGAKQELRGVAR